MQASSILSLNNKHLYIQSDARNIIFEMGMVLSPYVTHALQLLTRCISVLPIMARKHSLANDNTAVEHI